jgi:excinuclease ABC A subunit
VQGLRYPIRLTNPMAKAKSSGASNRGEVLEIVGADANNLRDVDVRFPLNRVTVVTGVSGSGKSSLLGDTLAVEADRRMRIFLGVHQPHIEGAATRAFIGPIPASIHVGQRAFRASSRTTVGTATGLLTTLRRFFIAHARPYSDELQRFVPPPSPASYARWLATHYRGAATVWAAPVRFAATDGVRCAERLRDAGVREVVIRSETDPPKTWATGRTVPLAKFKPLKPTVRHIIEANLGTVEIAPKGAFRAIEGLLDRAFEAGNGQVVIELPRATQAELHGPFGSRLDSTLHHVDPDSARCFFRPSQHLLSFNAPEHPESGACPTCHGLGRATTLDLDALVVHPERSMHAGAFSLWTEKNYKYVNIQHETIEGLRGISGFSPDVPWSKLPDDARRIVLEGAGAQLVTDKDAKTGRKMSAPRPYPGFRRAILERASKGTKISESLASLVAEGRCPDCDGTRWSFQARALRIEGLGIHHLLSTPFVDLVTIADKRGALAKLGAGEGAPFVRALQHHAEAFVSVGLGHISGDRGMLEVSEGEGRRARLAAVLNSDHAGLCMLLDEPARGLHDEDVKHLSGAITDLARAHTVVMNEHRHALVEAADHVIELGPGAGDAGGQVTYAGPSQRSSWANTPAIERASSTPRRKSAFLRIRGATIHNLDHVECAIPLGRLTCLTGLSGSGKSSFVRGVLVPAVGGALEANAAIGDFDQRKGRWTSIEGMEHIKGLVALDQKAPPPNRRSLVATFLELSEIVRTAYGSSAEARQIGLCPSDFGLNAGAGRCQVCLGIGEVAEHDQWVTCPGCGGVRFGQDAVSVRVEDMTIVELLETPVSGLLKVTPAFLSRQVPVLAAMSDLGIGHLSLGRRTDSLSGGEVQRLRIAATLAKHESGELLFVLDEPAAGLHPRDVDLLVHALDRIIDDGRNTVVLVEHNPAIIRAADWLIEFGPGSGPRGGRIVAEGSPEKMARTDTATGRVLSGKPPPPSARVPRSARPSTTAAPSDPVRQAERVRTWMRHLIGDDVALPDDSADDSPAARPSVLVGERFWQGRRALEVGDLDLEMTKLLLDLQAPGVTVDEIEDFAGAWAALPRAQLVIHPYLKEIQVWGRLGLPASMLGDVNEHLRAIHLELTDGAQKAGSMFAVRATGPRFVPAGVDIAERAHIVAHALAVGGGYAELRTAGNKVARKIGPRLLDLDRGIVGPMAVAPSHFSRHHRHGACPMCKGTGQVMILGEDLVLGDRGVPVEDERILHPAAGTVMKGVRRSELVPFFRRMAEEGLWDRTAPYRRLSDAARDMFLFGCWTRPGHGTFLKTPKDDPSEVGAWLRWEGLFRAVSDQAERSSDARWKAALEKSRALRPCPTCEGTGLAVYAKLLRLGERSIQEWARDGTVAELRRALGGLVTRTTRQERTQARILACLEPLAKDAPALRLSALVDGDVGRAVSRRVAEAFTDMPVVFSLRVRAYGRGGAERAR